MHTILSLMWNMLSTVDSEIAHFENVVMVRRTYAEGHARHGRTDHYEDGKHVRATYAEGHEQHGEITHFEDGKRVRKTYAENHDLHGWVTLPEDKVSARDDGAAAGIPGRRGSRLPNRKI